MAKLDGFISLTAGCRSATVQMEHIIVFLWPCHSATLYRHCLFCLMCWWRNYVGHLDDCHLADMAKYFCDMVEHGLVRWKVELLACRERYKPAPSVLNRDNDSDELSDNVIMSLAFILFCSLYKNI
jgi:hypothetical protein